MLQQLLINIKLIKEMLDVNTSIDIEEKISLPDIIFLLMERKSYETEIKTNKGEEDEFKKFVFDTTDKFLKNKIYIKIYDNLIFKQEDDTLSLQDDKSALLSFVFSRLTNELEAKDSFRQKRQLELNSVLMNVCISFESFVSEMVRFIYNSDEKNKNIKDKNITFNELTTFESLESARMFLIDKELDALFRDRFECWTNTVFNLIGLDLKSINSGIVESIAEMYQCRNLIVHANGIVNEQYLKNVSNTDYEKGQTVNLDEKYILGKIDDIKYIAWHMMNAFVIKMKKNINNSFSRINNFIVKYINEAEPAIPQLLEYYSNAKVDDQSKYIAKINYLLYYKIHGGLEEYDNKISSFSVDHLDKSFKIAKAILISDKDVITKFKEYIESLTPEEFFYQSDWPLFRVINDKDKMLKILNDKLEKILEED